MVWSTRAVSVALLAVVLVGCGEGVAAPVAADAAKEELLQRIAALKADVQLVGHLTDAHQDALEALGRDVDAWRLETGRTDLSVSRPAPARPGRTLSVPRAPGVETCESCAAVTYNATKTCFLVSEGACPDPGDIFGRVCVYMCFGSDPTPIRKR